MFTEESSLDERSDFPTRSKAQPYVTAAAIWRSLFEDRSPSPVDFNTEGIYRFISGNKVMTKEVVLSNTFNSSYVGGKFCVSHRRPCLNILF